MRRALWLDHFGPAHRRSPSGVIVLSAALLCAAMLALWHQSLVREVELLELQQLQSAPRRESATPVAAIDPRRLDDAARQAQLVADELRMPWLRLFDAIESAADPAAVALLSIEPDARRSALRISGEARNKKAMLDYMSRLGEQSPMVRAVLETHSQRTAGSASPVQFTLVAHWEPMR